MFDKELKDVMKSECGSRDFGTALQFLAAPPLEAECMMIKHACAGLGTDEKVLASIVCGRTNKELNMLKVRLSTVWTERIRSLFFINAYRELRRKSISICTQRILGRWLRRCGNLEKLIINVMQADEEEFDPGYHNQEKMEEDAVKLYKMGQG